jgi:hypothetical protein
VAVAIAARPRYQQQSQRATPALLLLAIWGLGLVANAFAVGALANVLDRLQGRVAWLLPLGALLLVAELLPALTDWVRARWAEHLGAGPAATSIPKDQP